MVRVLMTAEREGRSSKWTDTHRDWPLAILLVAGTAAYLSYWPRNLGMTDEGLYLYEAKRITEGAVLYRDVWEFWPPAAFHFVALIFWIFGPDMGVARGATALLHGGTAALVFLICRGVHIRPLLSVLPALAYVALCQPAWPYASPHWFTTFFSVLLLLALLRGSWVQRPRAALLPGLINGVLIATLQQKGVIMATGVVTLFLVDSLLARRYRTSTALGSGTHEPWRVVAARGGWFVAGCLLAALPFFLIAMAQAGVRLVFDAVVTFPLVNYRGALSSPWGGVGFIGRLLGKYTFPTMFKYLPILLLIPLLRAIWDVVRRRAQPEVHDAAVLVVFALFSMLSIAYFPDFIHIAFIAPVFFVLAAQSLELIAAWASRRGVAWAGIALAVPLLAAGCFQLARNLQRARADYPIAHVTAFGLIHFREQAHVDLVDVLRGMMDRAPGRELFSYPAFPSLYLMTDTINPTPFQLPLPQYKNADQAAQIIAILDTNKVPYVVLVPMFLRQPDAVHAYILQHYRPFDEGPLVRYGPASGFPTGLRVLRRNELN